MTAAGFSGLRRSGVAGAVLVVALVAWSFAGAARSADAGADVGIAGSGWLWASPRPQGSTLRAVDFRGTRGYAVGDSGVLLRSDDAGRSWRGTSELSQVDGSGAPGPLHLEDVDVRGPRSVVVRAFCGVWRSDDGGRTLRRLVPRGHPVFCGEGGVAFPTRHVGYVSDDGGIWRTTDGGRTFSRRSRRRVKRLAFTDARRGVAIADAVRGPLITGAVILRTTDGGRTWSRRARIDGGRLFDVTMASPNLGFAVGEGGLIARTTDGGRTWTRPLRTVDGAPLRAAFATSRSSLDLWRIRCASNRVCLVTMQEERVWRLTDDGATATTVVMPGAGSDRAAVTAAAFASSGRAVAVGFDGATFGSEDGGLSFARVGGFLAGDYRALRRGDEPGVAFALGDQGRLALSTDAGRTWAETTLPTSAALLGASFVAGDTVGYALDANGVLFRSENRGVTWHAVFAATRPLPRDVLALDARTVLLIASTGLLRSDDGGRSFVPLAGSVSRATLDFADRRGRTAAVFGRSGMWVARGIASAWRKVPLPTRAAIRGQLVGARAAYLLDAGHRLWYTADLGRSWHRRYGIGTFRALRVSFADARHGFALVRGLTVGAFAAALLPFLPGGTLVRTDDGGRTWHAQRSFHSALDDVLAVGRHGGIALGRYAGTELYWTRRAGDAGTAARLTLGAPARHVARNRPVRLRGRLSPSHGGEQVLISVVPVGDRGHPRALAVGTDRRGRFSVRVRLRRASVVVAEWWPTFSDDVRRAAGSVAVRVRVTTPGGAGGT